MSNSRKNVRTPLKVRLRIDHPVHGELLVTTRDISECGVYVLIDQAQDVLAMGEQVQGQVQGLPMEAPILMLEVVRVEALGVGLRFVQTEE
ncbi:PilZ domain-containing protein [Pseudomonas anguilliseptica]|uniref:PilZ domain-containing protein n=1 Tax=Pseudomonas anguilliseptica TaxID=53406 RepID=A0A1H4VUY9_PSEAG|nr:PilZ domain-containing protein [Pseudomonas anguilliseptica]SEC84785.1 PilZ domain-containing protein [Pseudomonas anguilliseptica]